MGLLKNIYKTRFLHVPVVFIAVAWIVELSERLFGFNAVVLGILPRTPEGLWGIVFSAFIHSGFNHLINNTLSFIVLSGILFYIYQQKAMKLFVLLWLLSGFWLWASGRPSYHIGASGLIYAMAAFHFFSGLIRWNPRLIVISLLVVFLYGYMVWGGLPADPAVSFEGHLSGALAGIVIAWFYRKEGPQKKKYLWKEDDTEPSEPYWIVDPETDEKPFGRRSSDQN